MDCRCVRGGYGCWRQPWSSSRICAGLGTWPAPGSVPTPPSQARSIGVLPCDEGSPSGYALAFRLQQLALATQPIAFLTLRRRHGRGRARGRRASRPPPREGASTGRYRGCEPPSAHGRCSSITTPPRRHEHGHVPHGGFAQWFDGSPLLARTSGLHLFGDVHGIASRPPGPARPHGRAHPTSPRASWLPSSRCSVGRSAPYQAPLGPPYAPTSFRVPSVSS